MPPFVPPPTKRIGVFPPVLRFVSNLTRSFAESHNPRGHHAIAEAGSLPTTKFPTSIADTLVGINILNRTQPGSTRYYFRGVGYASRTVDGAQCR
jgi:hypothetical protein